MNKLIVFLALGVITSSANARMVGESPETMCKINQGTNAAHQDGVCIKRDSAGIYNACVNYGADGSGEATWDTEPANCDVTLIDLEYTNISQVNLLVSQIMEKANKYSTTRFVNMTGPSSNTAFEGNKAVTVSGTLGGKQTSRTFHIKKTATGSAITARSSFLETLLDVLGYAGVSGDVDDSAGKVNLAGNAAGALDTDKCDNINTILGGTGIFPGLKRAYLDTDLTGATPKCSFTFSKQ